MDAVWTTDYLQQVVYCLQIPATAVSWVGIFLVIALIQLALVIALIGDGIDFRIIQCTTDGVLHHVGASFCFLSDMDVKFHGIIWKRGKENHSSMSAYI